MANPSNSNNNDAASSILDRIMGSQTQNSLNEFDALSLILDLLGQLKQRDREILSKRFGLDGMEIETLEAIGQRYNLTRERVRQIEKDSLNLLKNKKSKDLDQALQLIFDAIVEHGNIMSEELLMETMLFGRAETRELQAIRFLLNLGERFEGLKTSAHHKDSWYVVGFDLKRLEQVLGMFENILKEKGHVMPEPDLLEQFKKSDHYMQHKLELSDKALKSYLKISRAIQINPFAEIGLKHWSEVKPRDVGDKAYLVLKHHGKPEHYSEITKMINSNKFDARTAYQETVHNELIKDPRFVLVGRGIYALAEWGFKKGVVADVIKQVMQTAGKPLSKEEIMNEVMKQRQVKKNTILVALSNKKNFARTNNDKYTLAV